MEIAAEKDTKLIGREQKRFQQLYKSRREAYLKCVSTLKKSRRKKNINTDKQLSHMKMLESAKERLEVFCNDSLKEAVVQERVMYGTVLERQCALNRQFLIYHTKGCEILEEQLPHWEGIAETRDKLPDNCTVSVKNGHQSLGPLHLDSLYSLDSMLESVIRNNSIARSYGKSDRDSTLSRTLGMKEKEDTIYARPIVRAKSEYSLPTENSPSNTLNFSKRFSQAVNYNRGGEAKYVRALYAFDPTGDHQLPLREGNIIEFVTEDNATGWQFGDNLTTGRSGWFPLSYTDPVTDPSKYLFVDFDHTLIKPPPPLPATLGHTRTKSSPVEPVTEYATLTRSRKLLPVKPPTISTSFNGEEQDYTENGTLKAKHYASHPNIYDESAFPVNGKAYHNGQLLPSMRL